MVLVALLLAYLLGSIPFGLILTAAAGLGDVRKIGSGNIGATNVLRTGNKKLALAVLLLDGAKGYAAVWLAFWILLRPHVGSYAFEGAVELVVPFVAVLGHCYPVWLKFKGGKGVATALGALLGMAPPLGAILCAILCVIWVIVFAIWRTSSLAALVTFGFLGICNVLGLLMLYHPYHSFPLPAFFPPDANTFFFFITISSIMAPGTLGIVVLIFWRHRANIQRLLNGTEPRFGAK